MAINIEFTNHGDGLILKAERLIAGNNIIDAMNEIPIEKLYNLKFIIGDYTGIEEVDISNQEIEMIAEICRKQSEINPNIVTAVVAPVDLHYGIARMWEGHTVDISWKIQVFREMDKAKDWINEQI